MPTLNTPTPTRILVVDDHEPIRTLIQRLLRTEEGFITDEAKNGRVALARVAETPYDVITLDLMMPELDGFGFLAELERTRPELSSRVVVMTACSNGTLEQVPAKYTVLTKPFNAAELLRAVHRCAGH
ncbi:MAG TPA: response regulator [Thermoanaerobaculia bacterium]|nr:response regulator [Thermoanaerobaculia bacterium]